MDLNTQCKLYIKWTSAIKIRKQSKCEGRKTRELLVLSFRLTTMQVFIWFYGKFSTSFVADHFATLSEYQLEATLHWEYSFQAKWRGAAFSGRKWWKGCFCPVFNQIEQISVTWSVFSSFECTTTTTTCPESFCRFPWKQSCKMSLIHVSV